MAKKNILETTEPDIKPAKPVIERKVRQVSEWVEEVEAAETESIEPDNDANDDVAADFEDEPIDNTLDDFLGDQAEGYKVRVYRLPDYAKNGRVGLKYATREFCDEMPLTPDYLQIIKETWGPGTYSLELRDQTNKVVRRKPVTVAAPRVQKIINPATGAQMPAQITIEQQAAAPAVDPMKQLEQAFSVVKRYRDLLGITDRPEPRQEELTTEKALLHLASQNGEIVDRATKSLLNVFRNGESGGSAHEVSWTELLFEAIKNNTLPAIVREIAVSFRQPLPADATMPQTAQPAAAPAPPPVPIPQSIPPEFELLGRTIEYCEKQMPPASVAVFIDSFSAQHPSVNPLLEMFVSMTPEGAIEFIKTSVPNAAHVVALPHARGWIEELQKSLIGSDEADAQ